MEFFTQDGNLWARIGARLLALPDRAEVRRDLAGVRLAIYFDEGMDPNSALALGRAGQWAGCQVDLVNAKMIRNGELSRFHVLAIPGGERDPDSWHDLGGEGKASSVRFRTAIVQKWAAVRFRFPSKRCESAC